MGRFWFRSPRWLDLPPPDPALSLPFREFCFGDLAGLLPQLAYPGCAVLRVLFSSMSPSVSHSGLHLGFGLLGVLPTLPNILEMFGVLGSALCGPFRVFPKPFSRFRRTERDSFPFLSGPVLSHIAPTTIPSRAEVVGVCSLGEGSGDETLFLGICLDSGLEDEQDFLPELIPSVFLDSQGNQIPRPNVCVVGIPSLVDSDVDLAVDQARCSVDCEDGLGQGRHALPRAIVWIKKEAWGVEPQGL